ncbi:hypothetical protein GCM10010970_10890 [Silvimonas iriomotensis]|uniref:Uncharacterized protein n=1 Tax=Silvimonas iriomotensis TaxID=449662 RepID=A0ABQ2P7D2_9NEIS|nr:hypothetical protein GCM10010970_10890 [Silvimonas iriomotensis]
MGEQGRQHETQRNDDRGHPPWAIDLQTLSLPVERILVKLTGAVLCPVDHHKSGSVKMLYFLVIGAIQ